jgi:VWFA-related protein
MRTLLALTLCTVTAIAREGQDPQQPPRFRTGVDVVQMEVSVLDQDRRPVRGLTAADFTVYQDSRMQEIVAFDEVIVPERTETGAASIHEVAPDVVTNSVPYGRLVLLLLDDAMEPGPFVVRTKEIARAVVERLGPDDRAAVVFTRDTRNAQDFTTDRARLIAAIDRFSVGFVFGQRRSELASRGDDTYFRYSIDSIGEVARALAGIPHRRKVLVYVGIGVPQSLEDTVTAAAIGSEEGTSADRQGSASQTTSALGVALRLARSSNVTIYSIDSAGLGGLEGFAMSHPGFLTRVEDMRDYMRAIAENTGGRAAVEVNDYRPAVDRLFSENNSYYVIGYRATTSATDTKFRRVEVRVRRPGVTVRARSGYGPAQKDRKDRPASPLAQALAGVLPDDGIAMQATAAPFADGLKEAASVAIVAGLRHPVAEDQSVQTIELLTSAFTENGQARGFVKQTARLKLRPDTGGEGQYEILSRIDLKPGRYSLRIAAHDATSGRSGSVFYDLTVPKFSGEPLALSGVVLSAEPALVAAPKDALTAIVATTPTTRRQFEQTDRATALVRVYQRGVKTTVPVSMVVQVVDARGARVHSLTDVIGTGEFERDRSSDYRFTLPLPKLAAGAYLLTFEATAGKNVSRRDVRFTVR